MSYVSGAATLAAAASTGNNTHSGVAITAGDRIAVAFTVEAVGATPTVTWKAQGSMDTSGVADASATWVDLMLLPADSETAAKTFTVTATGTSIGFLAQAHSRFIRRIRIVTSSNTNVTYHASLY